MRALGGSPSYLIAALAFGLSLGPVAAAGAQPVDVGTRIYTEADLDQIAPRWPNPYRSFLPADAAPDWAYWRAKMRLEGQRRAARLAGLPKVVPVIDEAEPGGASGFNDTQTAAERIEGLGTDLGQMREVDVAGTLFSPPPAVIGPFSEDDGAIPLANDVGLTPGQRVRIRGFIGDGPHGSLGTGTGDFDVFKVAGLQAGQTVTIAISTPEGGMTRLDTKVALYDATGFIVDLNDNGEVDSPDSFLEVTVAADGDYYVLVRGINSSWPSDPFDPGSGPKAGSEGMYTVTIGLDATDVDFYSIDLKAGDVLGVTSQEEARRVTLFDPSGVVLVGSSLDGSILYPRLSPLPGGGRASVAYVVNSPGRHAVAAARGDGAYTLALRLFRPVLEAVPEDVQTLFLDFDGASLDAEQVLGVGSATAHLSPLAASLEAFGLDPTPGGADEHAVIDAVVAVVEENLARDVQALGLNPDFHLTLLNSRDDDDVFGTPGVSRVIVGGTGEELGLATVGIAESVDVGNFALEETAVVLLDLLSTPGNSNALGSVPLAPGATIIDLLGRALGNIVAHEAGHLFANFHTGHPDFPSNIMDGKPNLVDFVGAGPDGVFGNADDVDVDLGVSPFNVDEGFTGVEDTRNAIAFGLFGPPMIVAVEPSVSEMPEDFALEGPYPNPFQGETRFAVRVDRAQRVRVEVFDYLGRRVRAVFDDWLAAGARHVFALEAGGLPSGAYVIRVTGASFSAARPVVLVK